MRLSEKFDNKNFRVGVSVWATFIQSCKMSQIWQIYLCKDIKKSWGKKFVGIQNR